MLKASVWQHPEYLWPTALGLVATIAIADQLTGYELSLNLFYLLPVALVAWNGPSKWSLAFAPFTATVWFFTNLRSHTHSHIGYLIWDAAMNLGFFSITALLTSKLKRTYDQERRHARLDNLTGLSNSRSFDSLLPIELERIDRQQSPLSLAFVDLDNFKKVNDEFGHSEGDRLLKEIASLLQQNFRKVDIIARLGGDEFAILMPGTDAARARIALDRMSSRIDEVMKRNNWPVTMSVGSITTHSSKIEPKYLIQVADHLMYEAKSLGKSRIQSMTLSAKTTPNQYLRSMPHDQ